MVHSRFGVRCDVCSNNGFVSNTTCVCYSRWLDPSERCVFRNSDAEGSRRRRLTTSVTKIKTSLNCNCSFNSETGYFKQDLPPHQFGKPNPPVCDQCAAESYGPKPGSTEIGAASVSCTQWGDFDPNFANKTLEWRACANHGTWNGTACNCNQGWTLGDPIRGLTDSDVVRVCNKCAVNYGPLVIPNAVGAPYCWKVFTPNENGVPSECGGHGVFQYNICNCFSGYTLTAFENVFTCL